MLTVKEREGLRAILQKVTERDLVSLVVTITKGLIKTETSKYDKIDSILKYTERASLLLRRKKLKKEYIFQYLNDENVFVSITSEKSDCIEACLRHWQSPEAGQGLSFSEPLDGEDAIMEDLEEQATTTPSTEVTPVAQVEAERLKSFGETFTTWFYSLLKDGRAGAEHFWPDASLRFYAQDTRQNKFGLLSNAYDVSHFLRNLVFQHHILLDPNILSSKCDCDLYGAVTVEVSGVIHRNNTCIGLFDQVFGLVKDPRDDSRWKVKFSNFRMKINCELINQILILNALKDA